MKIDITGLDIRYKKNQVIKNADMAVPEGAFFTILGKSGSGKSTILKAIAGLLTPHQGVISMDGEDITHQAPELRKIGFVFQKPHLFPHLSVADNIAFGPEIHGWSKEKTDLRVKELMGLVQIEGLENRMPGQISGGQQQRAAIARALAMNHSLLLMDEPFSSLDPDLREEMGQLVKNIQKELGLTVIFVTHDVQEAMALSDKICYLSQGNLIQCGSPDDLYNRPLTKEVAKFMGDVNWLEAHTVARLFPDGTLSTEAGSHLLLRPQDLQIHPEGSEFTVIACERHGSETKTRLEGQNTTLNVISLTRECYKKGDTVGVSIVNAYWHYL